MDSAANNWSALTRLPDGLEVEWENESFRNLISNNTKKLWQNNKYRNKIIKSLSDMIRSLLRYLKWILRGKPQMVYSGYNCGCCGEWIDKQFSMPLYKSAGFWRDTWGICDSCGRMNQINNTKKNNSDNGGSK